MPDAPAFVFNLSDERGDLESFAPDGPFGPLNVQEDEDAPVSVPPTMPRSGRPRGLTLKSFTLYKAYEPWWQRWANRNNEIVVIASSFDGSGTKPFVFPVGEVSSYEALEVGETFEWTLGDGFPVFPTREIVGAAVVAVQIAESDLGAQEAGKAIKAAADALSVDTGIADLLKQLANPAKFTQDLVFGAVAEITKAVGAAMISIGEKFDPVALAGAQYSASGSWDGRLTQEHEGGRIVLAEAAG